MKSPCRLQAGKRPRDRTCLENQGMEQAEVPGSTELGMPVDSSLSFLGLAF